MDAQPAHGLSCHWPARCEKPRNDAGFGGFLGSGRKGGWWWGGTLRQTYVTQRLRTAANSCGKMRNSALVAGDPTSSHLRLASAASGYALRSFPRASTSTEKEINHHRLVLYLSTIGRAGRGLSSLVNIQSAQVVNIRSAATTFDLEKGRSSAYVERSSSSFQKIRGKATIERGNVDHCARRRGA